MSTDYTIKFSVGGGSNHDSNTDYSISVDVGKMFGNSGYSGNVSYSSGDLMTTGNIGNNKYYDGGNATDTWEKNKDYKGTFELEDDTDADAIANGFRVRLSFYHTDGVYCDRLEISGNGYTQIYTEADNDSSEGYNYGAKVGMDDRVGWFDTDGSYPRYRYFNFVPSGSNWKQVHMTIHLDSGSGADTTGPVWAKVYSQNIPYTNTNQALTLGGDININRESDGDRLYLNNRKDFQDGKTYYDYFYIKDSPESSFNWVQGDPFNVKIYNQSSNAIDIDYIHIEYNSITYKFDNNSDKFITDSNNNRIAIDNTIGWLSPQASDNKPTHRWFKLPGPGWHLFCSSTNTIETWLETKALWNITDRTVQQMYYWNELSLTSSSSLRANHWTAIDFGDTEKVPPNTAYWVQL
jgi:hypothetical protein